MAHVRIKLTGREAEALAYVLAEAEEQSLVKVMLEDSPAQRQAFNRAVAKLTEARWKARHVRAY